MLFEGDKNISKSVYLFSFLMIFSLMFKIVGIPFFRNFDFVYTVFLISFSVVFLLKGGFKINIFIFWILLSGVLSILLSNPLPVFRSWERWVYFCLLMIVASPLLNNKWLSSFKTKCLNWMFLLCVFIGVVSFICYFLGINYSLTYIQNIGSSSNVAEEFAMLANAGCFGGITNQSMMLGPISGIGACFLFDFFLKKTKIKTTYKIFIFLMICACLSCVFLSASRAAFASTIFSVILIFICYSKNRPVKEKLFYTFVFLGLLTISCVNFSQGLLLKQENNALSGGTFSSRGELWNWRLQEFLESPIYGVGFCSERYTYELSLKTGVIEPGSSWGAVFSQTGLLGGIPFVCIIVFSFRRLNKLKYDKNSILLLGVFSLLCVYALVEGFVFAVGNPLSFIFWILIGAIYAIPVKQQRKMSQL